MREIKFRGLAMHEDKWVYGLIFKSGSEGQWTEIQAVNGATYYVDPDTVGQYTGLKDKNGTEIYEGDVFKGGELYATDGFRIDNSSGAIVRFRDGMFKCGKISLVSVHRKGEVIGNIFDNPELLEGAK